MSKQQSGFTLIELVVVIVILGLLAATALPRFINVSSQARIASLNGVAGGLRAAASLAKAQALVVGSNASSCGGGAGQVCMDGTPVAVNISNYPTAAAGGITAAMQGLDGYTPSYAGNTATYTPDNGGGGSCKVAYDATTGTVTVTSSGCP